MDYHLLSESIERKRHFISKDGNWEVSVWKDATTPNYYIWYVTHKVYRRGDPVYGVVACGNCGNTPDDAFDEGKRRLTECLLKVLTDINNSR